MKLNLFEGCTSTTIEVDGVDSEKLSEEQLSEIIKRLLDKIERVDKFSILSDIISTIGEYKDHGSCDQCGSWISEYNLEV